MKEKSILVHSRKLSIYLQCKGFKLIGIEPNLKNSHKVYIFPKADGIQKAMLDYNRDYQFKSYVDSLSMAR